MNQHPVPMTRQGLVPALGRGQVQELARYKLPLRRERQLEGIAKAKAAGVYKGPAGFDKRGAGASNEGPGNRGHRDCQDARHRSGERLSCTGGIAGHKRYSGN